MKRRTFLFTSAIGAIAACFTKTQAAPAPGTFDFHPDFKNAYLKEFPLNSKTKTGLVFTSSCANLLPDLNGNRFSFENLRAIAREAHLKPVYLGFDHKREAVGFVVGARFVDRELFPPFSENGAPHVELVTFLNSEFSQIKKPLYTAVACIVNPTNSGHEFEKLLHFGLVDNPLDQNLEPIRVYKFEHAISAI